MEKSKLEAGRPSRRLDSFLQEREGGLDLAMAMEMVRSGQA